LVRRVVLLVLRLNLCRLLTSLQAKCRRRLTCLRQKQKRPLKACQALLRAAWPSLLLALR
jgi:hypothetical protein